MKRMLVVALVLIVSVGVSFAQHPLPFSIAWPDGWEVKEGQLPLSESGRRFDGGTVTVTLSDGESPAAVMLMTYMQDDDEDGLDRMFDSALATFRDHFEKAGMQVSIAESRGTLGGSPSLQANVTAEGNGVVVRQWLSSTMANGHWISLAYSAAVPNFEAHRQTFENARASLSFD